MRLGLLIVVGGIAGAFAPVLATPSGKIVRVERGSGGRHAIRFCFDPTAARTATCFGMVAPRIGDTITVIDQDKQVAELRVIEVRKTIHDCHNAWETDFVPVSGNLDGRRDVLGIIGGGVRPKGHLLKENEFKLPNQEQGFIVVDRDGDDTADIAVSMAPCGSGVGMCAGLWVRNTTTFSRIGDSQDLTPCVR